MSGSWRVPIRAAGAVGITAGFVGAYELRAMSMPDARRWQEMERWRARHMALTARLLGLELAVEGRAAHAMQNARPRVVVANHRSALDIVVFLKLFGGFMLSRADLSRWPVIGISARRVGTLFVERGEGASRAAAIRAIRKKFEEGASVTVFPEGGTFSGDEVRPFHAGAFLAARGMDVDVLPVGVAYEPDAEYGDEPFGAHIQRVMKKRRTRIGVAIGEARALTDDPRREASDLRQDVQGLVHRARTLLDGATAKMG